MLLKPLAMACVLAASIVATGAASAADGPRGVAGLMQLAGNAEAEGRDDRAAALYRRAHESDPSATAPLTAWGLLASRIGEPEQAVILFRAALAIEGHDRVARHGLADALVELDRGSEALSLYDALLTEDPGDGWAWNGKGTSLVLLGRADEAHVAFRTGLANAEADPDLRAALEDALAADTLSATPVPDAAPTDMTLALNTLTSAPSGGQATLTAGSGLQVTSLPISILPGSPGRGP